MKEQRKKILNMVEQGKLTAEEAIILLDSLEKETALSADVNWQQEKTSTTNEKPKTVKDKLSEFALGAFQKMKEFDFNFGPYFEVNHIFQEKDVLLKVLNVDIASGDVKLIPWDESDVRVECRAKVYKVDNAEQARQLFLQTAQFSVHEEAMRFSIEKKQIMVQVTIYIPIAHYRQIALRLFNGDITGSKLDVDTFKAKTAIGHILLSQCTGKQVELETANGRIELKQSKATAELTAETLNGPITIDGSFRKLDLQSLNGQMTGKLADANCETIFMKSKAGAIELVLPKHTEIDGQLKTHLGALTCELENVTNIYEKEDVLQKELHFISNKGASETVYVEVESVAGSISLTH